MSQATAQPFIQPAGRGDDGKREDEIAGGIGGDGKAVDGVAAAAAGASAAGAGAAAAAGGAGAAAGAAAAAAGAAAADGDQWREIIVTNFEYSGVVYCADVDNVVYDTEDVYFGVRPARMIGRRVDGCFVPLEPNPNAINADVDASADREMTISSGAVESTAAP